MLCPVNPANLELNKPLPGHVSRIAIKTGTGRYDGSSCRAVMEICDSHGNCCQTSPDGRGLDNPERQDRRIGQIDVYTNATILGTCAQAVIKIFTFDQNTKMTKSIHFLSREVWLVTPSQPNWQPVIRMEKTVISGQINFFPNRLSIRMEKTVISG